MFIVFFQVFCGTKWTFRVCSWTTLKSRTLISTIIKEIIISELIFELSRREESSGNKLTPDSRKQIEMYQNNVKLKYYSTHTDKLDRYEITQKYFVDRRNKKIIVRRERTRAILLRNYRV